MSEGLGVSTTCAECPHDSWNRTVIERLLDSIPDMFASTQIVDAALGGAVAASLAALVNMIGACRSGVSRLL